MKSRISRSGAGGAVFFEGGPRAHGLEAVEVKVVDPYEQLGAVEALLAGEDKDRVQEDARFAKLLSDSGAEATWVLTLTDRLRDALAGTSPQQLAAVAAQWARGEEFGGAADPAEGLEGFLESLAATARRACAQGHRLYCWVSL